MKRFKWRLNLSDFFRKLSIHRKILILTFVPSLIIAIALGAHFISLRVKDLRLEMQAKGNRIIYKMLPAAQYALQTENPNSILTTLQVNSASHDVNAIYVLDDKGDILTSSVNPTAHHISDPLPINTLHQKFTSNYDQVLTFPQKHALFLVAYIIQNIHNNICPANIHPKDTYGPGHLLGYLVVQMNTRSTTGMQYQAGLTIGVICAIAFLISLLISLKISQHIIQPIQSITQAVQNIKAGDYSCRVEGKFSNELKILKTGINQMATALGNAHASMQENILTATSQLRQTLTLLEGKNLELEKAKERALTASQVKSSFLANMSHEIRTPLNAIIGFSEIIRRSSLKPDQQEHIETIHNAANSLLQIINDILDFSKIEAGKMSLNKVSVHIRQLVENILSLLSLSAKAKGLELSLIIYPDVPAYIEADPLRLEQVLINIINNAIKFTPQGHIVIKVELDTPMQDPCTIKFSVQDTGIGIAEEQQTKLFEAFEQSDNSYTKRYEGTGLGLVICQRLVDMMGGNIDYQSHLGQGSTFWFTISSHAISPLQLKDKINLQRLSILLYEPLVSTRISIIQYLEEAQAQIQIANTIEEFKNMAKQSFDVYLVALNDTFQPKQLLRTIGHKRQLNIFFLNKYSTGSALKLMPSKSQHHIQVIDKPIIKSKLLDALKPKMNHALSSGQPTDKLSQPYTILAVDDNPANLKLMTTLLTQLNANVLEASSGEQAIELAQSHHIDLIFMDIQMPGLDGISTMQAIRDSKKNANIPMIALTAHATENHGSQFIELGFNAYKTKPIGPDELLTTIQTFLEPDTIKHNCSPDLHTQSQPEKATPKQATPYIDLKAGAALAGGNQELAIELLQLLKESLPKDLKKIEQAYQQKDWEALLQLVHRLHGGVSYTGAMKLKDAAYQLEKAMKNKSNSDWDDLYHTFIKCLKLTLKNLKI